MEPTWLVQALKNLSEFKGIGPDPFAKVFSERRKLYSLITQQLSDAQIEKFRTYIFNYKKLPHKIADAPVDCPNLIAGEWKMASSNVKMSALWDRRVCIAQVPDSGDREIETALGYAFDYWKSFEWSKETLAYRKHVVKNFSRMLNYFYEECLLEIRTQIPKTRMEADKDFWEGKRCADHLEGSAERTMLGDNYPVMLEGHSYWKNRSLPAGVSAIFTPMNFIYGIPVIQFIGAYLVGAPFILKGHPFAAISTTTMMRMLMAAGADPRAVQKVEGFGKNVEKLVSDSRVAVVCVTGSERTAEHMTKLRGLRTTKFEGGGCNWAWIDDGYSDEELKKIAIRLTYSKLGFSSHKCTSLHGVSASKKMLDKILAYMKTEMDEWKITNPLFADNSAMKVVGPCMVHKAQTAHDIMLAAEKAGAIVYRRGGKISEGECASNAEVIDPIILSAVMPGMKITINWDGKGEKTFDLATTEFFMTVLVAMESNTFDDFLKFSMFHNPHDLAVSIWSRNDYTLQRGRAILGGMLKENDGTDSALDWEEFGASGVGPSGNIGVGDPEGTFAIYSRRQKGRHIVF